MPRRVLTDAQLEGRLALPAAEPDLIQYWTLSPAEIAAIQRRRRDRNRLGFALQLCALLYPGRLLRSGECIPPPALRYVAHQLDADPEALAAYAARFQTRYEQLETLRETFGFNALERPQRRELLAWLLPVALTTSSAPTIAATLMDELRRRQIIVPGSSIIERMVATAVLLAERRVASQLTRDLRPEQVAALDALLQIKDGAPMSVLAWARQPPGARRHRALARLVEQLVCLRAVGLFDRVVGRLFRRAEAREENAVLRNAWAVNDKVRLLAELGDALLAAKAAGSDPLDAVETAVGWERLARGVEEARRLVRPDKPDLAALAKRAWPVLHRLGPLFLEAFRFHAVPAAFGTLRAVEILRDVYRSGGKAWPRSLPVAFLRPAWRNTVLTAGSLSARSQGAAQTLAITHIFDQPQGRL